MNVHDFAHEAMATTFSLALVSESASYARQASAAAFRELDRLELELSRFIESSDVARINGLPQDASTVIGEACTECLLTALRISEITARAFDPTYLTATRTDATVPLLALDPTEHRLTSLTGRLTVDLGAVGKGYALDRLSAVLRDWELGAARLVSGGSTVAAFSCDPEFLGWEVTIDSHVANLRNEAASASGLSVQGAHLVDPRTRVAARRTQRTWAFAPTAAEADALSTAFFVMSDAEVAALCLRHPEFGAALLSEGGEVQFLGKTPALSPPLPGA